MVTREKNGDGEIRGKAIEARRGEAARASAAVARVGRAPDGAARARAWIRRGEGVERAQLRVRVPRGANSDGPRGAAVRATKKKLSSSRSVHSCTRTHSSPRRVLLVSVSPRRRGGHGGRRARGTDARPRDAAAGVRARGRVDDAGGQARVLALGARAPSVRPSIRSFAHRRRLLPRARRRPSSLPRALSDPTTPSPPPSLPRRVRRSSRRRSARNTRRRRRRPRNATRPSSAKAWTRSAREKKVARAVSFPRIVVRSSSLEEGRREGGPREASDVRRGRSRKASRDR